MDEKEIVNRMNDEQHKAATLGAKKVRSYILAHPGCSSRDIVKATGLDPAALGALVGLIRCETAKNGKRGWWATPAQKEIRRASVEAIDRHIDGALAAMQRNGMEAVETNTPLSALLAKEGEVCVDDDTFRRLLRELDLDEHHFLAGVQSKAEAQGEAVRWLLLHIFERGVDPRVVVQRVFSVAKEYTPTVLNGISDEMLSVLLLDGGRATVHARTKLIAQGMKGATGLKTNIGTHHKRKSAA